MELSAKKEENVHYVVHLHVHTNVHVHVQLTNVQTMDLHWCLQLRNEHIHVNYTIEQTMIKLECTVYCIKPTCPLYLSPLHMSLLSF